MLKRIAHLGQHRDVFSIRQIFRSNRHDWDDFGFLGRLTAREHTLHAAQSDETHPWSIDPLPLRLPHPSVDKWNHLLPILMQQIRFVLERYEFDFWAQAP